LRGNATDVVGPLDGGVGGAAAEAAAVGLRLAREVAKLGGPDALVAGLDTMPSGDEFALPGICRTAVPTMRLATITPPTMSATVRRVGGLERTGGVDAGCTAVRRLPSRSVTAGCWE
jgi:hypothetical protein